MAKLIGTMSLPISEKGDVKAEMKAAGDAGSRYRRIFLVYLDGSGWVFNPFTPFKMIGSWKPGDAVGNYNQGTYPMYDLEQWDEAYWIRLHNVLLAMKATNQIPWFVFEDRCSENEKDFRKFNMVYYSNVQQFPSWQHLEDYANGVHPRYPGGQNALALNPYRERVEKRVKALCTSLGITELIGEPKNEYGYEIESPAYTVEDMVTWFALRCEHLRSLGFTVIGSIRPDMTVPLVAPLVDILDQHRIIEVSDIDRYSDPNFPVSRTIWNTDGAWNGKGPMESFAHIKNMSEEQATALGEEALKRNAYGVMYLSQSRIDEADGPWNADKADNRPTAALAKAMDQAPLVDVEVCATTNLLPNPYCPKVVRKFEQGEEPLVTCTTHTAPVPPEKPCLYFLLRLNIKHWLRCVICGKH